jgi:DNA topoisomerase-1
MASARVFAGECTTTYEGRTDRTQRGHVVVLVKPDRTVLVHDADGYQPVAWLTRPDSLTVESPPGGGFGVTARSEEATLRVVAHEPAGTAEYPVSPAGVPVGTCPDCAGALVRAAGGSLACLGCDRRHGLPAGATVTDGDCGTCGLPLVRIERGAVFEVCPDRSCDPLAARVRERFDGAWPCPDCESDLAVADGRGGPYLACETDGCGRTVSLPAGVVAGECPCGRPVFETARGRRCLDPDCDQYAAAATAGSPTGDPAAESDPGDDGGGDGSGEGPVGG